MPQSIKWWHLCLSCIWSLFKESLLSLLNDLLSKPGQKFPLSMSKTSSRRRCYFLLNNPNNTGMKWQSRKMPSTLQLPKQCFIVNHLHLNKNLLFIPVSRLKSWIAFGWLSESDTHPALLFLLFALGFQLLLILPAMKKKEEDPVKRCCYEQVRTRAHATYFCWSIWEDLSLSLLSLCTASLVSRSFLSLSSFWRSSSALRRSSWRRFSSSF